MSDDKIKLLYIVGNGRSGSTLLATILGQIDGFFNVGELRRVWDRAILEEHECGCGRPFRHCPVWQEIFTQAFGGMDLGMARQMAEIRDRYTQTKHLPGMVWRSRQGIAAAVAGGGAAEEREFMARLGQLYTAVAQTTGCRVIVDASKWPTYAYMLDQVPQLDIYYLHLVRDPRAVAFSWSRVKQRAPGQTMPRQSALSSTFYWLVWNPVISYFWGRRHGRAPAGHYLFLPYEQFVRTPRQSVADIARFIGETPTELPFVGEDALVQPTHAVAGNEARLASGSIKIRLDDEWQRKLPWGKKMLVSALTWPLRPKYGWRPPQ